MTSDSKQGPDRRSIRTAHLVKGEDLNHHGILYAGRCAEWCVEAAYLAASRAVRSKEVLCVNVHRLEWKERVGPGEIVELEASVVDTGASSLVVHVGGEVGGRRFASAFLTFVNVDDAGRPKAHGLVVEPRSPEEAALAEEARRLAKRCRG